MERRDLYKDLSDQEYIDKILAEIKNLSKQNNDPKDSTCKHCLTISLCERYDELKKIGYLK